MLLCVMLWRRRCRAGRVSRVRPGLGAYIGMPSPTTEQPAEQAMAYITS